MVSTQNVPSKILATKYYYHKSYVPTYYWVYMFLEKWIASTTFRNDTSRVFMASDDYAFRRRFELTDMSKDYNDIEASALRFPFANYWPLNSGWKADTRPAANTAAMVYLGLDVGTTHVRASAVTLTIPVQFYFDREDDARMAYDRLFFYTFNEHYYSTDVTYGSSGRYPDGSKASGSTLALPININVRNLQFNPSFKESDWLKKNRIFVIKADFECRSYIIFPPDQPDYTADTTSREFEETYDDGIVSYYPVEDVILNTVNKTWDIEIYKSKDEFPSEGKSTTLYVESQLALSEKDLEKGKEEVITRPIPPSKIYWRWNALAEDGIGNRGIYEKCDPLDLSASSIRVYRALDEKTLLISKLAFEADSSTSGNIVWNVENAEYLESISICIDSVQEEIQLSKEATSYKLENLVPNSAYKIYVTFTSTEGVPTKLTLNFSTRKELQDKNLNSLVGLSW